MFYNITEDHHFVLLDLKVTKKNRNTSRGVWPSTFLVSKKATLLKEGTQGEKSSGDRSASFSLKFFSILPSTIRPPSARPDWWRVRPCSEMEARQLISTNRFSFTYRAPSFMVFCTPETPRNRGRKKRTHRRQIKSSIRKQKKKRLAMSQTSDG